LRRTVKTTSRLVEAVEVVVEAIIATAAEVVIGAEEEVVVEAVTEVEEEAGDGEPKLSSLNFAERIQIMLKPNIHWRSTSIEGTR
jgi:hypothetical protein